MALGTSFIAIENRAGLLVGWSERGDRPEFDLVTGVSAGALIAPFPFLGRSYESSTE